MALRRCLKCLNPLTQKPGLDYALFLLKPSNAPYALVGINDGGGSVEFHTVSSGGFDTSDFEDWANGDEMLFMELDKCINEALWGGVKPNCGVSEIDEAVLEAQANPRDRALLERVKCLHVNAYVTRVVEDASVDYAIIKGLNPCGFGRLILLSGQGIHDLPQSKLGIARLLSQLIPGYIQVEEGWNEYTRLAYLIAKAPKELLPHVASLAGWALNIREFPEDRLEAYITTEALLSRELGYITIIDFEGDMPFIVKFPKSPFKPDES
jgi:hypothetical protein